MKLWPRSSRGCTAIDFAALVAAVAFFSWFREGIAAFMARLFGVTTEEAKASFLRAILQFRVAFIVLNLVPFIALTIMK